MFYGLVVFVSSSFSSFRGEHLPVFIFVCLQSFEPRDINYSWTTIIPPFIQSLHVSIFFHIISLVLLIGVWQVFWLIYETWIKIRFMNSALYLPFLAQYLSQINQKMCKTPMILLAAYIMYVVISITHTILSMGLVVMSFLFNSIVVYYIKKHRNST